VTDVGAGNDPPPPTPGWVLLNEEMRHRIDVQRTSVEKITGKAVIVLGLSVGAAQFMANTDAEQFTRGAAFLAYAVAAVAGLLVVAPAPFSELKPRSMLVGLWRYPEERAAAELANSRLKIFEANVHRQGKMVLRLRVAMIALVVGAALSVVALGVGRESDVRGPERSACRGAHGVGPAARGGADRRCAHDGPPGG
jgi:hypothetical protein